VTHHRSPQETIFTANLFDWYKTPSIATTQTTQQPCNKTTSMSTN